jgi:hypothetical protein
MLKRYLILFGAIFFSLITVHGQSIRGVPERLDPKHYMLSVKSGHFWSSPVLKSTDSESGLKFDLELNYITHHLTVCAYGSIGKQYYGSQLTKGMGTESGILMGYCWMGKHSTVEIKCGPSITTGEVTRNIGASYNTFKRTSKYSLIGTTVDFCVKREINKHFEFGLDIPLTHNHHFNTYSISFSIGYDLAEFHHI